MSAKPLTLATILALLALCAAAATAGSSMESIRAGLSADSRGARESAEEAARRLARRDPAGLDALWDRLDPRGRCGLVRALASAGTRHAALVALGHAKDPNPEVFRALLSGLAAGGEKSLFAELPEGLPAARREAIARLRLRWRVEAELVRLKGPASETGHYTGQFKGFKPLGHGVLPIFFDIVRNRDVPMMGEASSGAFEAIHPGMKRYDPAELRELVTHGFGELADPEDQETIRRLYKLWNHFWTLQREQFELEHESLAPGLAYSLHDLGHPEPVEAYLDELKSRLMGDDHLEAVRAMWSLGYAYIRIGDHESGERYYMQLLRRGWDGLSRDVAAYNLACNFAMRAMQEPRFREDFKRRAIRYLEMAVELNWWDWKWMEADGDLDFIRDMEGYKRILARLKQKYPDRAKGSHSKKLEDLLGGKNNKK